MIMFCEE